MNSSDLVVESATGVDVVLRLAGPGARAYAFLIDWFIRAILFVAWYVVAALIYNGRWSFTAPFNPNASWFVFVVTPAAAIYCLYHVVLEIEPRYQEDASALDRLYVRSTTTGQLVPLSALTRYERSVAPLTINHQDQFPSVTLSFNISPGYSLGDAIDSIRTVERTLARPATLTARYQGSAKVFESSLSNQPYLIAAAIIAVYLVLGVLYESFIHPLTILSTLPSAGVGALLALMTLHYDFSLIALIGMILPAAST